MGRSQITIFIIIGMILLLALSAVYFVTRESAGASPEQLRINKVIASLPSAAQSVRKSIEACVEDITQKAVLMYGLIGGKTTPDPWPGYFAYGTKLTVPFYYIKGTSYAPSLTDAQNILARHVDQRISSCVTEPSGLKITTGISRTKVEIDPRKANFVVRMPVKVKVGEADLIDLPSEYYSSVQVRLRDIVAIAQEIVKREVSDDLYIHWDYLSTVMNKGFVITAYPQDYATIVYKITDPDTRILSTEQFTLMFANMVKTKET